MALFTIILTILGLALFEVVSSIDNAIVNAEILSSMQQKARKWFLTWGIFIAVVVVRGILPFLIVWVTMPSLGPIGTITATFSNDPAVAKTIEEHAGLPLAMGGTFLIFLFFYWLFIEPKNYGMRGERFFHSQGVWFYTVVSIILALLVWFGLKIDTMVAFGVVLGSSIFFITHGFRQFAETQEKTLTTSIKSDVSKLIFLEVIDASFSIDGVIGAFAFTFSVPLIFLGNGLGVLVLRKLTISNIENIKKYRYLKNGAMYSILVLGIIMIVEVYGVNLPPLISPIATFLIVGFFFLKSKKEINQISK
ncbi:MAG: hypothetical protein COX78_01210 [Candidatus Levybacteria bacterium CG_4_10_14_0_2_um_filter_35_8]|nr:MAG: hypothetical protein COY68_00635 [Candidatus Levybacteria bacterium CG_4_10_14_0_8_um_filter_35_23]PIZ99965.1 MAG: hypothetical protein COX78_01210 [Candidatus Levybacteria bacterium CG_4_10_14_0_2_um_filter_35_8]PJC54881.1 MAG: hypothetical protein CO028_00020 [Candidatus Levybacteria bacterium CG_4_9_14_0_2_um_filter_35_21]